MKTFQLLVIVPEDRQLTIQLPADILPGEHPVVLVIDDHEQLSAPKRRATSEELGWPNGFFERVLGAWKGELERAPQGAYESRESLP